MNKYQDPPGNSDGAASGSGGGADAGGLELLSVDNAAVLEAQLKRLAVRMKLPKDRPLPPPACSLG